MSGVTHRKVKADDDGVRLDRWFKRHFPELGHGALAKMCRTGQIRVDGKRVDTSTRITAGADIRVPPIKAAPAPRAKPRPALDESDAAMLRTTIMHMDDKVIAINKPPGLPTQGGPGIDRHVDGMLDGLKFEREERPRLVHRLDKDTSGVLLLGRSAGAAAELAKAFRRRSARKIYWALVVGVPKVQAGTINMAMTKRPGKGGEKVVPDADGKAALTDYVVVDTVGHRCAWLILAPRTGRTHQLRVHCAEALGCPIVGDGKYGGAEAFLTGGVSRKLHLHARAITIDHPDGKALSLTAPLPLHMAESWGLLGLDPARESAAMAWLEAGDNKR
ncbi:MAG: RluA family pseudouridine synthase [Sphingomonadales bacterium]